MRIRAGNNTGQCIAYIADASAQAAADIIAADEGDENGRSQWLWVRLDNGDLLLATYPQGDTYFAHEEEREG